MNIIITGASGGIGYETAKYFCQSGNHSIIVIARSREKLVKLQKECHVVNPESTVTPLPFDLSQKDFTETLIPEIRKVVDSVDILINNAGKLVNKPVKEFTDQDFDSIFEVNVKSPFRLIRDLLPMMNTESHIVNISSMGGYQGSAKFPGLSLYSASKGALAILTECLAEELKDREIKVNCLALGAVQTEMLSRAFPGYKAPLTSAEMAEFLGDFAVNGHRFFNGKILPVSVSTP